MKKKRTPLLYRISKLILGPLFMLYYNPKIIGKENIPKDGTIIIAGNHKHLFDQCLTIVATKRFINYMAKKEYFDDIKVSWFFKGTGCISVDRSKKDKVAVDKALAILNEEGAIGIFPEGTRNRTEDLLLPFKFGAVSMAKKSNSYIVPFGIVGTYKFRSKDLTIRYGKPFKINEMDLKEANELLYNEVKMLMEGK